MCLACHDLHNLQWLNSKSWVILFSWLLKVNPLLIFLQPQLHTLMTWRTSWTLQPEIVHNFLYDNPSNIFQSLAIDQNISRDWISPSYSKTGEYLSEIPHSKLHVMWKIWKNKHSSTKHMLSKNCSLLETDNICNYIQGRQIS